MRAWLRRISDRSRAFVRLVVSEHASPREIAIAVALGAFIGCTPAFGLHMWIALVVATAWKKNRLFAFLGTRVSNVVFLPLVVFCEVEIGHRLRAGAWLTMRVREAPERAKELLVDWIAGCIPIGLLLALACGALAYTLALLRDRRRAR